MAEREKNGSLQGSHFDPCKKGIVNAPRSGATPITPNKPEPDPDPAKPEDFISETNARAIGLLLLLILQLSAKSSPARELNDAVVGLGTTFVGLARRMSDWWFLKLA